MVLYNFGIRELHRSALKNGRFQRRGSAPRMAGFGAQSCRRLPWNSVPDRQRGPLPACRFVHDVVKLGIELGAHDAAAGGHDMLGPGIAAKRAMQLAGVDFGVRATLTRGAIEPGDKLSAKLFGRWHALLLAGHAQGKMGGVAATHAP